MEEMLKVIRRLPPDRQQLLILKFVEGMSNQEVATIMMRSEGAIKSLYHRTLMALRDEMQKLEHT
jgi:RNA polymerase sigma-70 factor (ECF subfamily)